MPSRAFNFQQQRSLALTWAIILCCVGLAEGAEPADGAEAHTEKNVAAQYEQSAASAAQGRLKLDTQRPVVSLGSGAHKIRSLTLSPGHQIDARQAMWLGQSYPVALEEGGPADVTWLGGYFNAGLDRQSLPGSAGWKKLHSSGGLIFERFGSGLRIHGARFADIGDAIRIKGCPDFVVENVYAKNIGDDFIENDWQESGIVRNCLVDGCHTAFSTRKDSRNSHEGILIVENCLVRLETSPAVYRGMVREGHGNFWKEESDGNRMKFIIRNCIFAADAKPYTQGWNLSPRGTLETTGNTFVWLGSTPDPFPYHAGWNHTNDRKVWDDAVARWKLKHGI